MNLDNKIEESQLSEKELKELMFNKKRFRNQNLMLIAIYVVLIVLSLFII